MSHRLKVLCAVPGCDHPRYTSSTGRVYERCEEHHRQMYHLPPADDNRLIRKQAGLCAVPGCGKSRYTSRNGKTYTRCETHHKAQSQEQHRVTTGPRRVPDHRQQSPKPPPVTVPVMVIDWKTEQVFYVTGTVDCAESFPKTEGQMKALIARQSEAGVYVAYIRAYKEEDKQ